MTKMREDFESAFRVKFGRKPQNWVEEKDKYMDARGQEAWWGWKTALSSVLAFGIDRYTDQEAEK